MSIEKKDTYQYQIWYLIMSFINFVTVPYEFIFVILITFTIFAFAYIKIKYPFWNLQPVFHSYDFWRYFYRRPCSIQNATVVNKFYNAFNIKTFKYIECDEGKIDKFVDFLQCHYIESDRVLVTANKMTYTSYFSGQNMSTLISFYHELGIDTKTPIKGCLTSRAITIYYIDTKVYVYFIDYICIHRDVKNKQQIVYELIQTHQCNQQKKNTNIQISLLKKEGNSILGVIPIVKFNKFLFYLPIIPIISPEGTSCLPISKTNLNLLLDFIDNAQSLFQFVALADLGNIISLLNNKEIFIYCFIKQQDVLAFYFFRNAQTQYEDIGDTLEFIGSYNNTKSNNLFLSGFLYASNMISKDHSFKLILYENVSHNIVLLDRLLESHSIIIQHECFYYLYNYIIPNTPLNAYNCFFLF